MTFEPLPMVRQAGACKDTNTQWSPIQGAATLNVAKSAPVIKGFTVSDPGMATQLSTLKRLEIHRALGSKNVTCQNSASPTN
ncbi:hypothetical protein J6590_004498 [Homalodisca vitripennis]|nr:hypothetical protein J6590_004498 [Homalodisca vitripennis]